MAAAHVDFQLRGLLAEHKIATSLLLACSAALGCCLHAQRASDLRYLRGLLCAGVPQQSTMMSTAQNGMGRLWGCLRLLKLIDMVREMQSGHFIEHGLPLFDAEVVRAGGAGVGDGAPQHSAAADVQWSMRVELVRQGLLSCFVQLPQGNPTSGGSGVGGGSEGSCAVTPRAVVRAKDLARLLGWLPGPSEVSSADALCGMAELRAEMMPLLLLLGVGGAASSGGSQCSAAALRALQQCYKTHPLEAFARSFLAWSRTIAPASRLHMHSKFSAAFQSPPSSQNLGNTRH
jgi:hypothetical protein